MNSKEELKSAQEDKKFLQASSDSEQTCEENSSGATLSSGPAAAGVEEQNLADKPPSCGFDADVKVTADESAGESANRFSNKQLQDFRRAKLRRRRNCILFLCSVVICACILLASPNTRTTFVNDEDLGLAPLPSNNPPISSQIEAPEWQKRWEILYEDLPYKHSVSKVALAQGARELQATPEYRKVLRHSRTEPEQLVPTTDRCNHRINELKALDLASEVAQRRDSQYIPAELRKSLSLERMAHIESLGTHPQLEQEYQIKSLEIKREILGASHYQTLRNQEQLGHCYLRNREYKKAKQIYKDGLGISEEAFGRRDKLGLTYSFATDLAFCPDSINGGYSDYLRSQYRKEYTNFDIDQTENIDEEETKAAAQLYRGDFKGADKIYRSLIKRIAMKEGINSKRLKHTLECYGCALEAQDRLTEAKRIRDRLNLNKK